MAFVGSPTYSVKYYREGLYKLIKFKNGLCPRLPDDSKVLDDDRGEEGKFSQSISRAKSVIYQVAVCNDWEWFVTFTIDPNKFDRYDFRPFYKVFTQWIRDYRKKYGCRIEYILIPEQHQDGAWHMHGLMRGIPADHVSKFIPGIHPQKLVDKDYRNWGRAGARFGFCSMDFIHDPMKVAGYVTKYITKDLLQSNNRFGAHLYMCSIGLRRAVQLGYVYGSQLALDRYISNDGQFCSTGWIDDRSWDFVLPWLCSDSLPDFPVFIDVDDSGSIDDSFVEFDNLQLHIAGWASG